MEGFNSSELELFAGKHVLAIPAGKCCYWALEFTICSTRQPFSLGPVINVEWRFLFLKMCQSSYFNGSKVAVQGLWMPPWAFHVSAAPLGAHLKPLGPDMCGCTGRAVSPSPNSIPALAPWKESSLSLVPLYSLSKCPTQR